MPPRASSAWRAEELPTYDFTHGRSRLIAPAPLRLVDTEPSPLMEAIRAYLERAR